MKIRFTDAIADFENPEIGFKQFKLTSDIIVPEDPDVDPYVNAILLYDSESGHKLLNEPVELDLIWLLTHCDIYTEKVIPAETCWQAKSKSDERQTIRVKMLNNALEEILYNAKPSCNHLIVPQSSGIKCRCCNGWYCAG